MNVYWVSTYYKEEDCFVVALNKKAAIDFHADAEGFEEEDVRAKEICQVPNYLLKKYFKDSQIEAEWAHFDLLEDLDFKIIRKENPPRIRYKGKIYNYGLSNENILLRFADNKNGVYVIKAFDTPKVKIGYTNSLIKRLNTFNTGNPENLKVHLFIACENFIEVESILHKEFQYNCIGGEWFHFKDEDFQKLTTSVNQLDIEFGQKFQIYNFSAFRSSGYLF